MERPPDRLTSSDGTWSAHAHRPPGRRVPAASDAERRERMGRVVWLMPDTGVFPLWSARGAELHRRLQSELGPDWEVVFEPE